MSFWQRLVAGFVPCQHFGLLQQSVTELPIRVFIIAAVIVLVMCNTSANAQTVVYKCTEENLIEIYDHQLMDHTTNVVFDLFVTPYAVDFGSNAQVSGSKISSIAHSFFVSNFISKDWWRGNRKHKKFTHSTIAMNNGYLNITSAYDS